MEAVKTLEGSRDGLPGVRGAERSDSSGGNRRGPVWPGDLCVFDVAGSGLFYNRYTPGSERLPGRESEAAVVPLEPGGQHNRR